MLGYVRQFLGLSLSVGIAEFKLRNENSYLGVFWYLLDPFLTFLLLLLVFSNRLGQDIPQYPVYLLLGIILFNFFRKTSIEATQVMRYHRKIIKSINFPYETLVGAVVLKNLFSHFFEIFLFGVFMVYYGGSLAGLVFYPLLLLVFCVFILGVCFILAPLAVYSHDVENVWTFSSHLLWFATPIFYAIGGQGRLGLVNLLNPLFYFIEVARMVIVYGSLPSVRLSLFVLCFSLSVFILGGLFFKRFKFRVAELI